MTSSTRTSSPVYIVQSIPARRGIRQRLLEQLPPAVVVEDDGPPPGNPWRGFQLCLQRGLQDPTEHIVLLQDDAIVCRNFMPAVELLIERFPCNVLCLFYPGLKMKSQRELGRAIDRKRSLFVLNRQDFIPVVGTIWPREKAESLLAWSDGRRIPGLKPPYRSDDAVSGAWMRYTKQDVFVTLPSLVQHPDDVEPVKDGPQKAGYGHDRGRVAFSFCEGDPLEIEWVP